MIVDYYLDDWEEFLEEQFSIDWEKAKLGGLTAIQKFTRSHWAEQHYYDVSKSVSNETLHAILSGKVTDYYKIDSYDYEQGQPNRSKNNFLLIRGGMDSNNINYVYHIEAIFISNDFL